jgi:hypothetical protein
LTRKRPQTKHVADVRMKSAVKERLTASGTAKGASAAEELAVEIAGAVDVVSGVVSTEVHGISIDVAHEDQDLPYLDVEIREIGGHFVIHRQEISIPMYPVAEVTAEEMNPAVDRFQLHYHLGIHLQDRAHLLGVGVAQIQDPYHHIRDAGPHRLVEIAEATVAEVLQGEEEAQIVVIVGDRTRLPMTPDLGLRRLASEEEVLQSP